MGGDCPRLPRAFVLRASDKWFSQIRVEPRRENKNPLFKGRVVSGDAKRVVSAGFEVDAFLWRFLSPLTITTSEKNRRI